MDRAEVDSRLHSRFTTGILSVDEFPGTLGKVRFDATIATDLFRETRDALGFAHLSMVGAVDRGATRDVFYVLWSDVARQYLLLWTTLPADHPSVATATSIWPSANWHEREAWEMVGIQFEGHPDLRHLLMPDGYTFQPLLRSFKLHEPEELEVKVRDV